MKYNNPGKTGIKISKLGFGVARLPEIKVGDEYFLENETVYDMVVLAVEKGINYFDPGDIYCHGQSQRAVSSALKEYRDDVYLANKIMTNKRKNKGDLIKNTPLYKFFTKKMPYRALWCIISLHTKNIRRKVTLYDKLIIQRKQFNW